MQQGSWTLMILVVPSNPSHSVIPLLCFMVPIQLVTVVFLCRTPAHHLLLPWLA